MTISHKWTAIIAAICLGGLVIAVRGYMTEHDARTKAETITTTSNAVVADRQTDTKQVLADMQTQLNMLATIKQKTITTTQIVRELPAVMPLPTSDPVVHEVTAAQANELSTLPDAPVKAGDLVIPAASAKDFFDAQVTCKQNSISLDACTKVTANDTVIIGEKDKIIAADVVAIKGGTFWQRTWHDAKIIGIAGGAGLAIGYAAHH